VVRSDTWKELKMSKKRMRGRKGDSTRRESGLPGGGAGRRDEVGGSGVYPASGPEAPQDAVVRTPGEWGAGAGGEVGGRSELHFTEEELRAIKEAEADEERKE
jgi:hypothetical protein